MDDIGTTLSALFGMILIRLTDVGYWIAIAISTALALCADRLFKKLDAKSPTTFITLLWTAAGLPIAAYCFLLLSNKSFDFLRAANLVILTFGLAFWTILALMGIIFHIERAIKGRPSSK